MSVVQAMHAEVAASLRGCQARVREAGFGFWRVDMPALAAATAAGGIMTARMEADWLLFDGHLGNIDGSPVDRDEVLRRLLAANGQLAAGAKFALVAASSNVRLRAELPLGPEVELPSRIESVWAGLQAGWALWHRTGDILVRGDGGNGSWAGSRGTAECDESYNSIRDACGGTGWPLHERPDGRLLVDLEVPADAHVQAEVSAAADGGVWVRADIAAAEQAVSPTCATAIAILLLRLSGVVRLARATVGRLEVMLPAAPQSSEIARALSALSVASRLVESEARLLSADDALARAYLVTCGVDDQAWCDGGGERAVMFNRAGGDTPPAP